MKYKSSMKKQLGGFSFKSAIQASNDGAFIAHTTLNGTRYEAIGKTEREATIRLTEQMNNLGASNKIDVPT